MAQYELLLPKMGESVAEATIIRWNKNPGDSIDIDDTILEIATDKVDSEVPSPVAGKMLKQLFKENDIAQVGDVIAILEIEGEDIIIEKPIPEIEAVIVPEILIVEQKEEIPYLPEELTEKIIDFSQSDRFYSPLVKSIAQQEGLDFDELAQINGSGSEGRVTKDDLLQYIANKQQGDIKPIKNINVSEEPKIVKVSSHAAPVVSLSGNDEIIEMDRMRKLIAEHMVSSKQISAHVTSFVEADVTNMVLWRNKIKNSFEKREGEKITFTPIFIEAVAKAIKDLPMINISVSGNQIIKKKDINIGMATALPSGNLIVPVIKNADQLNLVGITKSVNDLANRSRANKLKPDEVQGGTFTITNLGTFGNIMGTPIINQPQVAILALGAIVKKPAVLETVYGDVIAIRHMMFLSLSYDHRVVDGGLGGSFVRKVADYLEAWDSDREI